MHRNSSTIKIYQFGYLSFTLSHFHAQTFKNTFCLHFAATGDINGKVYKQKYGFKGEGGGIT